jgi:hypothetical protein
MPIYEFECKMGHRLEIYMTVEEMEAVKETGIQCTGQPRGYAHLTGDEFGNGRAYKVWSSFNTTQIGKPTIAFVNPQTGEARIAVHPHEQPPAGFVKEEIKGSIERTRFEQTQNAIHAEQDAIYNEQIRQKREEFKSTHIAAIKSHLADDAASSENPAATESLMNAAIERIRKKDPLPKKRKTEFKLDVNHIDKSNL